MIKKVGTYYERNKALVRARAKARYAANKDEILAKAAAEYREKNPNPNERGTPPVTEKVCPICGVLKPRSDYYKKLKTISHKCKTCTRAEQNRLRGNPEYREAAYRKKNAGRAANKDNVNAETRRRYAENSEDVKARQRKYYADNRDVVLEKRREQYVVDEEFRTTCLVNARRCRKATPPWADKKAIRAIYKACPEGHHVDHVIPLKGKIDGRQVSGLHIAENLQHLTAEANMAKGCRITEADLD